MRPESKSTSATPGHAAAAPADEADPDRSRAQREGRTMLTVQEVADRCGLSGKAIYRAVERGDLRASKLCSRLRINSAEVEAWIERSSVRQDSLPMGSIEPRRMSFAASNGLRSLLDAPRRDAR